MAKDRSIYGAWTFAAGALLAGSAVWLLDPSHGRRRRMQLRDSAVHAARSVTHTVDRTSRDVGNRVKGTVAGGRSFLRRKEVPDEVLLERVRSRLGRVISHPNAIQVQCSRGSVILSGAILEDEVEPLLASVRSIKGCAEVIDHLEAHRQAGSVPDLQGKGRRRGPRSELRQENWTPAWRIALGAAGTAMVAFGLHWRKAGSPLTAAGAGVLLRATSNRPLKKALGLDGEYRGIEIQKTTFINAPVERVYKFWSHPENFPLIMSHVKDVKRTDGGYQWTVEGPGGVSASWEAAITENLPNRLIGWESRPGAAIRNAGYVRFDEMNGGTRVHVHMAYNPVGGVLSHALFSLLGADPKHALDDDMVRIKSLFEKGKTTVHHRTVTRDQLSA